MPIRIMPDYKYLIRVDDKVVWEGLHPKDELKKVMEKNRGKEISIVWVDLSGDVLIAKVRL